MNSYCENVALFLNSTKGSIVLLMALIEVPLNIGYSIKDCIQFYDADMVFLYPFWLCSCGDVNERTALPIHLIKIYANTLHQKLKTMKKGVTVVPILQTKCRLKLISKYHLMLRCLLFSLMQAVYLEIIAATLAQLFLFITEFALPWIR